MIWFFFPPSVFVCAQDVRALGFFELQILEIENYRGQLATGECCGGASSSAPAPQQWPSARPNAPPPPPPLQCSGAPQCNTLFQVCLREYQSQAAAAAGGRTVGGGVDDDASAAGSPTNHHYHHHQSNSHHLHHCSFGNVTSPVLGGNSFTLGGDASGTASDSSSSADSSNRGAAGGNLALPFSFSWTVSTLLSNSLVLTNPPPSFPGPVPGLSVSDGSWTCAGKSHFIIYVFKR